LSSPPPVAWLGWCTIAYSPVAGRRAREVHATDALVVVRQERRHQQRSELFLFPGATTDFASSEQRSELARDVPSSEHWTIFAAPPNLRQQQALLLLSTWKTRTHRARRHGRLREDANPDEVGLVEPAHDGPHAVRRAEAVPRHVESMLLRGRTFLLQSSCHSAAPIESNPIFLFIENNKESISFIHIFRKKIYAKCLHRVYDSLHASEDPGVVVSIFLIGLCNNSVFLNLVQWQCSAPNKVWSSVYGQCGLRPPTQKPMAKSQYVMVNLPSCSRLAIRWEVEHIQGTALFLSELFLHLQRALEGFLYLQTRRRRSERKA
jgi:hypothetical protein